MANVRELRAISLSNRKSDQGIPKADTLRPSGSEHPAANRTPHTPAAGGTYLISAQALLVRLRTAAVNAIRGLTKACGYRMSASTTTCLRNAARPFCRLLWPRRSAQCQQLAEMAVKVKQYDRQI